MVEASEMLFFSEVLLISARKICISPSSGSVFPIMHKNFRKGGIKSAEIVGKWLVEMYKNMKRKGDVVVKGEVGGEGSGK